MIKGLHHNAYRCRDSEATRRFYEDFLGLPLASTLEIRETKTGRKTDVLHTFYRMDDGSFLAFFEAPDAPFEFKRERIRPAHPLDLRAQRQEMSQARQGSKARRRRHLIHAIYFRDPAYGSSDGEDGAACGDTIGRGGTANSNLAGGRRQ